MGVKIQKPGEPGHPGENRRIYVRVNYGGHRKTRMFNSSKAAERYATDVEAMLKLGKLEEVFTAPGPLPQAAPTVAEVWERWLAVESGRLKTGTLDTYGNAYRVHIAPVFGGRRITEVTDADIENWWVTIQAKGFSRNHLGNIRTLLDTIFQ
jgi:hypothetical protein